MYYNVGQVANNQGARVRVRRSVSVTSDPIRVHGEREQHLRSIAGQFTPTHSQDAWGKSMHQQRVNGAAALSRRANRALMRQQQQQHAARDRICLCITSTVDSLFILHGRMQLVISDSSAVEEALASQPCSTPSSCSSQLQRIQGPPAPPSQTAAGYHNVT